MRRKSKQIALILLIGLAVVIYFYFNNSGDLARLQWKKIADYDRHFIPFCDRNEPDFLRMISSSLKTLDFFESRMDSLVTDVAVGTRIMEAQINILLKTRPDLSPEILQDLKELQQKSNLIGDTIVQRFRGVIELHEAEDATVARMKKNLNWIISASTWETPINKGWKTLIKNNERIDIAKSVDMAVDFAPLSDGCIFGTFENCEIPDYCIDFMWREPHSGYLLTHQILFHYMIGRNDCFSGKRRLMYESQNLVEPTAFLETMCRRVITETKHIESINHPDSYKDLFVEQILVCSLAGYNDFLTTNWTNVFLDWSLENGILGCATQFHRLRSVNRRVKRWDSNFQLGNELCSSHMGALILGVIGQQLRYYLEMCYDL